MEALELLEVHRAAGEGVVVSVLLVCTHRRFERCSRALMRRLDESDLLGDDHLDVVAMVLLGEDRVCFAVPARRWAVRRLLERGLVTVEAALDVLALTGRLEEARALAREDGAAQVRAWQPRGADAAGTALAAVITDRATFRVQPVRRLRPPMLPSLGGGVFPRRGPDGLSTGRRRRATGAVVGVVGSASCQASGRQAC